MAIVASLKYLRSNIVGGSTKGSSEQESVSGKFQLIEKHMPSSIIFVLQASGKPEVSYLKLKIRTEKNVAQFQIAVNDTFAVHVRDSLKELHHEMFNFGFR